MASAEIIALLNSESEGEEPPAFAMDASLAAAGWHASDAPGASAFQAIDLGSNNSDEDPYADSEVTALPQEDGDRRQGEGSTSKDLGGDGGGSSGGSAADRLTGSRSSMNSFGDDTPAFFHGAGPGTPESESTATGSSLDALDPNDRPHPSLCDRVGVSTSPHDPVEEPRKGNSGENPGKSGDIVEHRSETEYVQNDRRSLTILDEIERLSGDEGGASPILARGEENGATAVAATFAGGKGNEEERCREDLQGRTKGAVSNATYARRGWLDAETGEHGGGIEGATTVGAAVQESRGDASSSLGANDSAATPCLEQKTASSLVGAEMRSGSDGPFDPGSHADDESLQSIIDSLPSGFVQCPRFPNVYELVPNEDAARGGSSGLAAQDLPKGATLSRRAAMRHNGRHRFRCPACSSCFCGSCRATPYHFGFDCAGWKAHQSKPKCTFCGNSAVDPEEGASAGGVRNVDDDEQPIPCCEEAECRERATEGCRKKLPCGHPCRGPGSSDCLPCLESGCSSAEIDGDAEFCNVCWTESLVAAPCVKLGCGHFVHVSCGREQLRRGRPTARLTFGFMSCPVCRADKALARHPYLGKLDGIDEQLKLAHEVEELALQRLRADELPPLKRSPMENIHAKMRRRVGPHFRPRGIPYPPLNAGINLQRRMQPAVRFPPVFPERWARAEPGEWQPLAGLAMDWMPPFFRGPFAPSPPPPLPPYVGGQGGAAVAMAVAAAPAASARAAEDRLAAAVRESYIGLGGAAGGGLGGAPSPSYSEEHRSHINHNRAMPIAHADTAVARSLKVLDVGRGMSDDPLREEIKNPEDAGRGPADGLMEFKRIEEFRNGLRLRPESLRSQRDSNKRAEKSRMEDNWPPHDEFRYPSRWARGIVESPNMCGSVAGIAGGSGSGARDDLSELQRRRAGNPLPLAEDLRRTRRMLEESLDLPVGDGSSGKRKLQQREEKNVKSEQVQEAWGWGPGSRGWREVDGRPLAHRGISAKNYQEEGWDGRDSARSRGVGSGNDPSDAKWVGRGAEVRAVGAEDCLDRISAHSSSASPPGSSEQGPPQRDDRSEDPAQPWLHMFPWPVHVIRSTAPRENKAGTDGARDVRQAGGAGRGARYDAPAGSDDEVIILERRGRKIAARTVDQLSASARKQIMYGASHDVSASPPPPSPFDGLSPSPPSPLSSPGSRSPEELLIDWFPDHSPRLAPSPPAKGRQDAGSDWLAAANNGHDGLEGRNKSDKRSREDWEDDAANAEDRGAIKFNDDLRPKLSKRVHFAAAGNEKKQQQQQQQLHGRPFHADGRGAFGDPWVFGGVPDLGLGPAFRIDKQARKKQAIASAMAISAATKSAAEIDAKHGAEDLIERRDGWKDGKIDLAAKGMYSLKLHVAPASSRNGARVDEGGSGVSSPRAVGNDRAQLDAGSASETPEAPKKEDSQTVLSTAEVAEVARGKEDRTEMVSRALKRYSFYQCHSCRKPYFGGLVSCEPAVPPSEGGAGAGGGGARGWGAAIGPAVRDGDPLAAERAVEDVKAQELLCGKCSASNGGADCPEHGQEFMEHKCYWCCRKVASYFCGGVMHFCDICHLHGFAAKAKHCPGGIKCVFGGHHPEKARNGQDEFVLGCGICRPKPGEEEVDDAEQEPAGQ